VRRLAAHVLGLAVCCALAVIALGLGGSDGQAHTHEARLAAGALPNVAAGTSATWCGTPAPADRRPNALAGHAVHWVYAVPADGADALGGWASAMQTDAEAIDLWWRLQDPTRTPRNDLAPFPCGQQLDITTLRFQQSSSQLAAGGRFNLMANGLQAAGLGSAFTKQVVYYDGPVSDGDICGQGGSDRTGFGLAVVYLRACAGVSHAVVVAHELLHSLGAVATGAPNECTGENDGHVCDDGRDLLYPYVDLSTLETKILDIGRDDYYGHSGSWTNTRNSQWLVRLDAQAPLSLTLTGPGGVSADVPGLECAATCTTTWNAGTRVTMTATPRAGAKLVRWGGGCRGAAECTVSVGPGSAVTALFAPATFRVAVRVTGQGTVRSGRAGIACRPRCASAFPSHVPLALTAKPADGWRLRGWTGVCRGRQLTCRVPMTGAVQARATFVRARR
jgi:Divergent InlB B-repeat domain